MAQNWATAVITDLVKGILDWVGMGKYVDSLISVIDKEYITEEKAVKLISNANATLSYVNNLINRLNSEYSDRKFETLSSLPPNYSKLVAKANAQMKSRIAKADKDFKSTMGDIEKRFSDASALVDSYSGLSTTMKNLGQEQANASKIETGLTSLANDVKSAVSKFTNKEDS